MIKLRLKRYGKKREASYRIVVANSTSRRDGRPLEELGFYNPRTDEVRLNVPRILERLQQGAQPTDTVRDILRKANVFEQTQTGVSSTPSTPSVPAEPEPSSATTESESESESHEPATVS